MRAKSEPNLFQFMFRPLNLLLFKQKICQLEAKTEAKNSLYFYVRGFKCLNQIPAGLREPTK